MTTSGIKKHGKIVRRGVITIISLLILWPVAAWSAAKLLIVYEPIEKSDAIVVLSGSAT